MPWAASPPITFCQEKVTTSSLSHSRFWAKAAEVASQITMPVRSLEMKSALGTRTPEVVPFQANTRSASGSIRPRSGSSPNGETSASAWGRRSCSTMSVTQSLEKLSQAATWTGLGPSIDHMAISTAPVSEAGTMPIRKSSGTSSTSRVAVDGFLQARLDGGARWLRPTRAPLRFSRDHPGRLAHGPDEKLGRAGRMAGFGVVFMMSPILTDEQRPVGRAWPAAGDTRIVAECEENFDQHRSAPES